MAKPPEPPRSYRKFVGRYPKLEQAWELIHEAGADGPLDEKTARLVRLGVAIGAQREGSVHASVRKGLAAGITQEEMEQVVALSVGTIGLPSAVAAFFWLKDVFDTK
jgi:alkylhydroperoxidase/carboxymuconolactone decarboxylase family protein YurZ